MIAARLNCDGQPSWVDNGVKVLHSPRGPLMDIEKGLLVQLINYVLVLLMKYKLD